MEWSEIKISGVIRIDRCVAEFNVWVGERLPFVKFRVKVFEMADGSFQGSPNVAIRNPTTGFPEWIGGLGETIEEALEDTVHHFFREIEQYQPGRELQESDFCWSDPEDF